jgi:hypothetical protein
VTRKQLAIIDALGWPAAAWIWMCVQVGADGAGEGFITLMLGLWALRKLGWALDDGEDTSTRFFGIGLFGIFFGKEYQRGRYEFTTWLFARIAIMFFVIVVPISLISYVVHLLDRL